MDIKIKAKLQAYSKGILPTKISQLDNDLDFISDVQDEGVYVRSKGEWINADSALDKTKIELLNNSGLNLVEPLEGDYTYKIGIRKWEGTQNELNFPLDNDTTYYIEDLTADDYINGGTSWSDGNNYCVTLNEFSNRVYGGKSNTQANIILKPLNSKGVYNG